jgi:hypothetical protein
MPVSIPVELTPEKQQPCARLNLSELLLESGKALYRDGMSVWANGDLGRQDVDNVASAAAVYPEPGPRARFNPTTSSYWRRLGSSR